MRWNSKWKAGHPLGLTAKRHAERPFRPGKLIPRDTARGIENTFTTLRSRLPYVALSVSTDLLGMISEKCRSKDRNRKVMFKVSPKSATHALFELARHI